MTDVIPTGIFDWVKGQPFNNVLIASLLGMFSWLGWYGITFAIPSHITAIQSGYREIETSHTEQRALDREDHRSALKAQQEIFEKTLDRIAASRPVKPSETASK